MKLLCLLLINTFVLVKWVGYQRSTVNGCGMDPLLVLVSPCFRENKVVTCKIGSFLRSLDNLLKKKKKPT